MGFDAIIKEMLEQQAKVFKEEMKGILEELATAPIEEPLTIDEAALFLHLSKPTLYLLVQKKKIPHYKKCSRIFFYKSDLNEWIKGESTIETKNDLAFIEANKKKKRSSQI